MQMKTATHYHFIPTRIAKIKNHKKIMCGQKFSITRIYIPLVRMQIVTSTLENYLVPSPHMNK